MFFLLGPTAVGKSALAVELAARSDAEIINADAFQIYAGLEILTAAPGTELRCRVPHHLVGTISATQPFDVGQFRHLAEQATAAIEARGKRVLVAGGTGLYVRALSRGLAELPPADPALRARLEQLSLVELSEQLRELDPATAARIDAKNRRRLVRAVEVCLLTGRPFSTMRQEWNRSANSAARGMILLRDRAELYARIDERVDAMFERDAVIEEVRALGAGIGPTAAQAIGLREIRLLLGGELSRAQCIAAIQQATRRYAKRQMTWLRHETGFSSLHLSGMTSTAEIIERSVLAFMQE
jgi:tRNA dimethylallyltransferase